MASWLETTLTILIQVVLIIGLVGSFVPFFPGPLVMWLSALGFGFIHGWNTPGLIIFGVITLLFVVSTLVDNLFMGAGARKGGAAWLSIFVALAAGIVGTVIFPPFGGLIASPVAVFLLEYSRLHDAQKAWQALSGLAAGYGLSYLARFGIGLVIMALWWLWLWKG